MSNNFLQFQNSYINGGEIRKVVAMPKNVQLACGDRTTQFEDDYRNYFVPDYSVPNDVFCSLISIPIHRNFSAIDEFKVTSSPYQLIIKFSR